MKKLGMLTMGVAVSLVLAGCSSSNSASKNTSAHDHQHQHTADAANADQFQARWKFEKEPVVAKQDQKLQIFIEDKSGKPINDFDEKHTKLMHLIVVSKDLSYFNHIHPVYAGKGLFEITTQLPAGGDYQFIADVAPKGSDAITLKNWTNVDGAAATQQPLQADKTLTKVVDGKEVTLSFDGDLKAKTPLQMKFHITDAATKQPITTLEPYLGAVGHSVVIDEKVENYVHVHPMDEKATGPDAVFHTEFPKSGLFKVWGQFQLQGNVFTVPFVVAVK